MTSRKADGVISIRNAPNAQRGLWDLVDYINNPSCIMAEIGSYVGDSTEIFAKSFTRVVAIDPWENGYDPKDPASYLIPMSEVEAQFDRLCKIYKNIVKLKMPSAVAAPKFLPNTLDFVYIDGIHTFHGVASDIATWLPKIKEGGFIGGHDYSPKFSGVKKAVGSFHKPDKTFKDTSWIISVK